MPYLMDDLATVANLVGPDPGSPLLQIFPLLKDKLQGTPRFLLNEETTQMAVELTLGRPKVLLDAVSELAIPYPRMWIEWPEKGREKLRETFYPNSAAAATPTRPIPDRIGMLLECDSARKGMVTWVWSGNLDNLIDDIRFPNVGAISPYFDLDRVHRQAPDYVRGFLDANLAALWQGNPVQEEALLALWRTAEHKLSPWGEYYAEDIYKQHGEKEYARHIRHMHADVYGEYIMIWGILLMLSSSRRVVDYRIVDRSKINKLRKQKRQPLLFDHTEVTLHVGERHVVAQRGQPLGYRRKSPRIHLVSSFLNRRGNKHWVVTPFLRGSGEMIHRQIKVVK